MQTSGSSPEVTFSGRVGGTLMPTGLSVYSVQLGKLFFDVIDELRRFMAGTTKGRYLKNKKGNLYNHAGNQKQNFRFF